MQIGLEQYLILSVAMAIVAGILAFDASRYPAAAFTDVGSTRRAWQVGPVVLAFLTAGFGTLVAVIVWVSERRQEVATAAAMLRASDEPVERAAPEPPVAEPMMDPAQ